jgi:hypothetical protein
MIMYKVIYTVESGFLSVPIVLCGLVPVVIGCAVWGLRSRLELFKLRGSWYPAAMIAGGCFWLLACLVMWLGVVSQRRLLRTEQADVLEGIVESYEETSKDASFTVAGRQFFVEPFRIGPGYKILRRDGSVLARGARVRIHASGKDILMLEVRESK